MNTPAGATPIADRRPPAAGRPALGHGGRRARRPHQPFKELSPSYFYDERGSELFEQITELPEYYPTRAERAILDADSPPRSSPRRNPATLIELGSGSAAKTRVLLDAMRDAGALETYAPVDISEEITRGTADKIAERVRDSGPRTRLRLRDATSSGSRARRARVIAFLGGTIGNFAPSSARSFLARVANLLGPGDHFLLGTDLIKDRATLEAAYNDSAGVTAAFNMNVLDVLNRELGADFDPERFEHVAFWDDENLFDRHPPALAARDSSSTHATRHARRLRAQRGDAHRDLDQVPPRGARGDLRRGRSRDDRLVDRPRRPLRAQPRPPARLCDALECLA